MNWLGFLLLKGLASRRGRPLSLGELLTASRGLVFALGAKIVDVYVRRVRRRPCYLGGRPGLGRRGGIGVVGCRRGPDHRAGTA